MSQPYIDLLRTAELHPLRGSGGVPSSRTVTVTGLPLTATGGPLGVANVVIGIAVSPSSVAVVGVDRTITCTAPLLIGGGASADLSANRTLSITTFAGAGPGAVPGGSGADPGLYLSGAGTWVSGTVVGVSSLNVSLPLFVNAATGAVSMSINLFTTVSSGIVPASGSSTLFLRGDGTWQLPGAGSFISLQGSSPGSTETGHGHISGTFMAGTSIGAGTALLPQGPLHVHGDGASPDSIFEHAGNNTTPPAITFRKSRGTELVPLKTIDGDTLMQINTQNERFNNDGFASAPLLRAVADGTADATFAHQRFIDLFGGMITDFALLRMSAQGTRISNGETSIPINSVRAKSTLDVIGSLGLKSVGKTASFTAAFDNTFYYLDNTSGDLVVTLPSAATYPGRVHGFMAIADTTNKYSFNTTIDSISLTLDLYEIVLIQSDGSNWHRIGYQSKYPLQKSQIQISSSIGTSAAKADFDKQITIPKIIAPFDAATPRRVRMHYVAKGQYTTHASGTNSIVIFVRDVTNNQDILESRSLTLTNGTGTSDWTLNCEIYMDSPTGMSLIWGELTIYDAAGDHRSVLLDQAATYNANNTFVLACGAQWSNANSGNQINVGTQFVTIQPNTLW